MIQFETIRYKNFLSTGNHYSEIQLDEHCTPHTIEKMQWHQPVNLNTTSCKVIEVQIGKICEEADIERYE